MRKLILFATTVLLVLGMSACVEVNLGKGGKKLKPSENIVKNEYKMEAFTKIDIDVVAKVKFEQSQDGDYRVVLQAPENYVELFDIKVEEDELEVGFKERNVSIESAKVGMVVYAPTLQKLENNGVANIHIDSLNTQQLKIENDGVGNMKLKGLKLQSIEVESGGVGNIELSGQTERATLECNGVGNIDAVNMKAVAVKAVVNGVGGIDCHASERLKGDVNGVGSLKYSGQPKEKQLHKNGVGKISEL